MCGICGCSEEMHQDHVHAHHHAHEEQVLHVTQDIFAKNKQFAAENRAFFLKKKILALNVMSSPGSGKTTLLARTITDLHHERTINVLVGDQHTDLDAQHIQKAGGRALQINTGTVCHLDAHQIGHALEKLSPAEQSLLIIENIGNLVCPALFDLGAQVNVVILSVTEGDNKPLKYPDMFRCADLVLITKTDLLPYVDFDLERCREYATRIQPKVEIQTLSSVSGAGLSDWYDWIRDKRVF